MRRQDILPEKLRRNEARDEHLFTRENMLDNERCLQKQLNRTFSHEVESMSFKDDFYGLNVL